jgi:purine nucleosidase
MTGLQKTISIHYRSPCALRRCHPSSDSSGATRSDKGIGGELIVKRPRGVPGKYPFIIGPGQSKITACSYETLYVGWPRPIATTLAHAINLMSCRKKFATAAIAASWLALLTLLGACQSFARAPVILSTDVGNEIDDQWVVAYLLVDRRDFNVLGIISAHAPTLPDPSAGYTYRVLRDEVENRLNMSQHPPLFEGSSLPLQDAKTPRPNAGVDFIIATSRIFSSRHRLDVLTIGAATDVASAILEDPSIVHRIRIVAMGFKSWPEGGDEFNVANDYRAWQVILSSGAPVVVGCATVCRADLSLTLAQARSLISTHGPIGAWLWSEFQEWYFRFVKPLRVDNFSKPWVIWDMITAAYVQGWTRQQVYPRPSLSDAMQFDHNATQGTITWITHVDSRKLWADFLKELDYYQRAHAVESHAGTVQVAP